MMASLRWDAVAPGHAWLRRRRSDSMDGFLRKVGDALRTGPLRARAAEDSAVIRRCQDGDLEAFRELVRRYQETAVRLAMGFLRNPEEAVDASQDAFVRALEAICGFDPEQPFYPWFYAILRNVCFNRLRRIRRLRELPLEAAGDPVADMGDPGSGEGALSRAPGADAGGSGSDALRAAMDLLSPDHREILILRHWQEMSYEDIAAATDAPLGTVMSRLHYARRELRRALEDRERGGTTP